MSYGIAIRTVNGLESIENLRSLREVYRATKTTTSGSQAIPGGADANNAVVFFKINDGNLQPLITWSGSTLTWTALTGLSGKTPSSNFDLIVCRLK